MNSTPCDKWTSDWTFGVKQKREKEISSEIIILFKAFWGYQSIEEMSPTSKRRYSAALHALGGYIVEQAVKPENYKLSALDLLYKEIDKTGGHLVYFDEESWQKELDTVCKKLYKFINLHNVNMHNTPARNISNC